MDIAVKNRQTVKRLKELTLLDRFLFAETMEDKRNLQLILSIILGKELELKGQPQVEKELRTAPWLRSIRLDVYTTDEERRVYSTEVQKINTGNLVKRSRFYQALIDGSLLMPGEIDFNEMQPSYLISIMPFDLWGYGRYKYTFRMTCQEQEGLLLEDGASRIFLNTHGTNGEGVGTELIELLHYMEHTTDQAASHSTSQRIKELHGRVSQLKASEEIGVKYMQEWEERIYLQQEARAEGESVKLIGQVRKKAAKGITAETCADMLEEEVYLIEKIYDMIKANPDWDDARIYEALKISR